MDSKNYYQSDKEIDSDINISSRLDLYLEQSFSNILGEEKHTHVPKTDLNFPPLVLILENPNTPFHIFFL